VFHLRQADVELGKEMKVPEVCKQLGIREPTYYRWRQKYGGMDPTMAQQFQELEKENSRIKRLVADQALDLQIIKETAHKDAVGEIVFCMRSSYRQDRQYGAALFCIAPTRVKIGSVMRADYDRRFLR